MHISRLRIKNYRNFGEPDFEVTLSPFTLILGENNIGKTNLVSAVALLFGQDISAQQSRRFSIDDINFGAVSRFKKAVANEGLLPEDVVFPEVQIEADLVEMNETQHAVVGDWYADNSLELARVSYRFSVRGNFDTDKWIGQQREAIKESRASFGDGIDPYAFVDFPIRAYRHVVFGSGVPSNECDPHLLGMLRVEFLDALRDANRELVAGGEQRLLYRILNKKGDSRYADLKSSLAAVKTAVDRNEALKALKADVADLLDRVSLITPGADNSIDFHFTAPDAAELLKKVGLIYGADPITVDRNGLGRNNLLYVALVISQLARTDDPDEERESYACFRVVAIEEPEAHLHPHLQDHLARNIESIRHEHHDSLQLLLTSHSTHLAAKLELANTVVVFRGEDGTLKSQYVLEGIDPVNERDSVRFLSLYLDATKSRLLFARSVILVEGIAEQIIVPLLFEKDHGQTLESIGCSVINVGGVAFSHFLTVMKNGLYRKCVVLTDSDRGTRTEERAGTLKRQFDDGNAISVQISAEQTFEKDLFAANRKDDGRTLLLRAAKATRPQAGAQYAKALGENPIDVDALFKLTESCKAEFAFNLATEVMETKMKLTTPKYIADALAFIAPNGRKVGG